MHCPSCGTETGLETRFCRKCGLALESVGKLVADHSSPEDLKLEKSQTEKAIQQRMYRSLMWGMISFILGMAVLVVVKTFSLDKTINLIGTLFLFIAMGLMTYGVLSRMRDGPAPSRKLPPPDRINHLPQADTTKQLPSERVPVPLPSVTERTTQLIAADDVAKPRE